MAADDRFEELVTQALTAPFSGWGFSYLQGRIEVDPHPWDYRARVLELVVGADSLCDLGTGGGEFVAGLDVRPPLTVATEGWMPNVPVADATLRPLGVHVVAVEGARDNAVQTPDDVLGRLPFRSDVLDAVIDRHEAFLPAEVARVLRPGGTFLTQQVGSANEVELNEALGAEAPDTSPTLDEYAAQLEGAGLDVIDAREASTEKRYLDVGAVVYNTKAMPWQFAGFDPTRDVDRLRDLHRHITEHGAFTVHHHRLLLEARKG